MGKVIGHTVKGCIYIHVEGRRDLGNPRPRDPSGCRTHVRHTSKTLLTHDTGFRHTGSGVGHGMKRGHHRFGDEMPTKTAHVIPASVAHVLATRDRCWTHGPTRDRCWDTSVRVLYICRRGASAGGAGSRDPCASVAHTGTSETHSEQVFDTRRRLSHTSNTC